MKGDVLPANPTAPLICQDNRERGESYRNHPRAPTVAHLSFLLIDFDNITF